MTENNWINLTSFFPKKWKTIIEKNININKSKALSDPYVFMRLCLLYYGCGYSFKEISIRSNLANICKISSVSFHKWLCRSKNVFKDLCFEILQQNNDYNNFEYFSNSLKAIKIVDATIIKEHGITGKSWRLHYCLELPNLSSAFIKVTDTSGKNNGETLKQFNFEKGDYILADRAYSHTQGIFSACENGAKICIRIKSKSLNLKGANGHYLDLDSKLKKHIKNKGCFGFNVRLIYKNKSLQGRIHILRKSDEQVEKTIAKLKSGKYRGKSLSETVKLYAHFIVLFSNFEESFNNRDLIHLYKLRWQVELLFKRFKSIASLGKIPTKNSECSLSWLYGKLFTVLLCEHIQREAEITNFKASKAVCRSSWREFEFMFHTIQDAIRPIITLKQVKNNWVKICELMANEPRKRNMQLADFYSVKQLQKACNKVAKIKKHKYQ